MTDKGSSWLCQEATWARPVTPSHKGHHPLHSSSPRARLREALELLELPQAHPPSLQSEGARPLTAPP